MKKVPLKSVRSLIANRLLLGLAFSVLVGTASTQAQIVIESRHPTSPYNSANGWITQGGGPGFSTTGATCKAPGCDPAVGTWYCTMVNPSTARFVELTPQSLVAGQTYQLEVCVPCSGVNICSNMNVTWSFTDADDGSGNPPALAANTFSSVNYGLNKDNIWFPAGTFRAVTATPKIRATFANYTDTRTNSAIRWNLGAYRLSIVGDPRNAVPQLSNINGPLAAGLTTVTVTGVTNGATTVYIYANDVKIGTNSAFGTNTTVTVNVSPLLQYEKIQASQVVGGVEGYPLSTGPIVGGGPTPGIRVVFEVGKNETLTGPAGTTWTNAGSPIYWMGSGSRLVNVTGSSFRDGASIFPGTGWQTVIFDNNFGPNLNYFDNQSGIIAGNFGILAGIAIAPLDENVDTGPYQIFIDNIKNGSTVLFDAETNTLGSAPFFNPPKTGGNLGGFNTTANVLSSPNLNVVVGTNADTGTKSLLSSFQFASTLFNTTWLHMTTKTFPQVDLSQPISMRVLVLPVGTATNAFTIVSPVKLPNHTNPVGSSITFDLSGAVFAGTDSGGTLTYQWQTNAGIAGGINLNDETTPGGAVISGTTTPTLQINNTTEELNGATFVCVVTTQNGASSSVSGSYTVGSAVVDPVQITYTVDTVNDTITLNWTGTGWTLQQATTLTPPADWADVVPQPGGNSYTPSTATGARYFRLIR